ncbi:helix-turn-helix domain-containing protein [Bacillus sp. CMF12]|uniref:helix-turn-helix transcriptional regulator n=1 Tax=Bacillus sp. CMF12 TaxID=2884834 RepID=UPI0020793027|nr:helix-turn-helix transcriptional regulator [Bacillus sp. CMF12]USK48852.1 helix-turn-helix domain-containing protein [Bacillus sp. CMF12]
MNNYDIKEIKITFKMASSNPKYEGNVNEIIRILADEYNVPFDRVYTIIFGKKMYGNTGTNLRILRMTRNLTQKDVAATLGFHCSTICYWELNKGFPKKDHLEKIAEFYGVSVEEITEEENC